MSAAILDRVRAFDILSQHMTPERCTEIADALGAKLLAEITPTARGASEPRHPVVHDPDPERVKFDETAQFLSDHGYSSGDQVRAAGRLEEFLKKHPNLTREAGMRVWVAQDGAGA